MIIKQKKKKNLGIHQLTLFNIISCLNNLIILQKSFCYLLHIDKHLVIRIEVFCSQDSIGKLFTMRKHASMLVSLYKYTCGRNSKLRKPAFQTYMY